MLFLYWFIREYLNFHWVIWITKGTHNRGPHAAKAKFHGSLYPQKLLQFLLTAFHWCCTQQNSPGPEQGLAQRFTPLLSKLLYASHEARSLHSSPLCCQQLMSLLLIPKAGRNQTAGAQRMAVARNLNLPPEAEREKGYFREDIYLKTGLRCRNALERPKTQQTFLHFCSLCFFFCQSLTYTCTGWAHLPFLRVEAQHLGSQEGRTDSRIS